jgi:two-component system, OmpR family, osmolarity sensor histidine kinase EnvZ
MASQTTRILEITDGPPSLNGAHSPDELTFAFLSKIGRHLAHELNNSISAISSSAYLVKDIMNSADGSNSGAGIQPFIEGIEEECDNLKSVVEEFSKYVSTVSVLKMPMDIVEFLQARADEMTREGLPVKAVITAKEIFIEADPGALSIVLRNIADFAISEGATSVSISIEDGGDCSIAIRDNRPISRSLPELKEAFSPIPTGQRIVRGLGLKLPLAERIVKLHGGSIEFPETTDGQTEIRIILPQKGEHS